MKITHEQKVALLERAFQYVAGSPLKLPLSDTSIVLISDSCSTSESYPNGWTFDETDDAGCWLAGALIKLREGLPLDMNTQK